MIELTSVTKAYGPTIALHPITLVAPAGRTTVLIGPSGCGKSTLIRVMIGLVWPDAGSVRVCGEALEPGNLLAIRRRVGYVIQDGGLFPHLTAEANVALMARFLGWPEDRVNARLDELAALVRLDRGQLVRFPGELSGGQRQRVGIMRALMLDPDVLLLDEPMGALDPMIRSELQEDLRAAFGRLGKTVVIVTHDLGEAGFLGDRIVLLKDGSIVQQGSLDDLVNRPADPFVTRFVRAQRGPLDGLV